MRNFYLLTETFYFAWKPEKMFFFFFNLYLLNIKDGNCSFPDRQKEYVHFQLKNNGKITVTIS